MMDFLLSFLVLGYDLLMCKYTKVEESFNTQAIHDLLFHASDKNLSNFDHLEFSGPVPRTFIGPSIISTLSAPVILLFRAIIYQNDNLENILRHYLGDDKTLELLVSRFVLGLLLIASLLFMKKGVEKQFGKATSFLFLAVTLCEFHSMFYFSRFLPNTFALFFVQFALGFLLKERYSSKKFAGNMWKFFFLLGFGAFAFRSELLALILPFAVSSVFLFRNITLFQGLSSGLCSFLFGALLCFIVDSYFWKRFCWAELEVFIFNTIANKSSEWGIMPRAWYFTNTLPKMFLGFNLVLFSLIPVLVVKQIYNFLASLLKPKKEVKEPRVAVKEPTTKKTVEKEQKQDGKKTKIAPKVVSKDSKAPQEKSIKVKVVPTEETSKKTVFVEKENPQARKRDRESFVFFLLFNAFAFIALYSLLPHKELRFIFYVIPIFNLAIAFGIAQMFGFDTPKSAAAVAAAKKRSFFANLFQKVELLNKWSIILLFLGLNFFVGQLLFVYVSSWNYYGGDALKQFHKNIVLPKSQKIYLHMDDKTLVNGVSKFNYLFNKQDKIRYSKAEGLKPAEFSQFTHVLTENPTLFDNASNFKLIHKQVGLQNWKINKNKVLETSNNLKTGINKRLNEKDVVDMKMKVLAFANEAKSKTMQIAHKINKENILGLIENLKEYFMFVKAQEDKLQYFKKKFDEISKKITLKTIEIVKFMQRFYETHFSEEKISNYKEKSSEIYKNSISLIKKEKLQKLQKWVEKDFAKHLIGFSNDQSLINIQLRNQLFLFENQQPASEVSKPQISRNNKTYSNGHGIISKYLAEKQLISEEKQKLALNYVYQFVNPQIMAITTSVIVMSMLFVITFF